MPLRETAYQAYTFLAVLYAGMMSAFLFDLLSPLMNGRSFLIRIVSDLIWCALSAAFLLAALVLTECDSFRFYMAIAMAAGAALYRLGIRRIFLSIVKLARADRKSKEAGE